MSEHPELAAMLACLHDTPGDDLLWLAVADWLEEDGQPARAELLRLTRSLRGIPDGKKRHAGEDRMRKLLWSGVEPCVPEVVNSLGMRFVLIPPGTFWMGATRGETGHESCEVPRHEVEITRPFWLGVTGVTQSQYRKIMRANPSHYCSTGGGKEAVAGQDTGDFPVSRVTWTQAVECCRRLSARKDEKEAGRVYRLPTEAEREYACRAGRFTRPGYAGAKAGAEAPSRPGAGPHPRPVGGSYPNAWGLYDMQAGLWEWCHDWFAEGYYARSRRRDPRGPSSGTTRAQRGGSDGSPAEHCRAASRNWRPPEDVEQYYGFRVCFTRA